MSRLADWRKSKGLTQQRVADLCETTLASIARYEAGTRIPEPATMRNIYRISGGVVRPDHFYDLPELPALAAVSDAA